jgi:hypothetical protein
MSAAGSWHARCPHGERLLLLDASPELIRIISANQQNADGVLPGRAGLLPARRPPAAGAAEPDPPPTTERGLDGFRGYRRSSLCVVHSLGPLHASLTYPSMNTISYHKISYR